ncbi:hypothetical protein KJ682_04840 [bacterium]|nr:hypothetical protein [bacterium]
MESNLSILEAKVLEAVGLIKELRAENVRLQGRCQELEAGLAGQEEEKARLARELAEAREGADLVEAYEEKRKEIEDKVGGLLQQLEALG